MKSSLLCSRNCKLLKTSEATNLTVFFTDAACISIIGTKCYNFDEFNIATFWMSLLHSSRYKYFKKGCFSSSLLTHELFTYFNFFLCTVVKFPRDWTNTKLFLIEAFFYLFMTCYVLKFIQSELFSKRWNFSCFLQGSYGDNWNKWLRPFCLPSNER